MFFEKEDDENALSEKEDENDDVLLERLQSFDYENNDDDINLLIVATNQNKPKLADQGYFYTIDKKLENNISWKCKRTGNKTTSKCMARALSVGCT